MRPTTPRRSGFTLVELLVAAALALVAMTVLSLAFQTGLTTLSHLKSVVGMAEQLRAAEAVLRRDLAAPHLESDFGEPVRLTGRGPVAKGYVAFTQGGQALVGGNTLGFGPYAEARGEPETGLLSFRTQSAQKPLTQSNLGNPATYAESGAAPDKLFGRAWMDTFGMTVRLAGDKPQEVFAAAAKGNPAAGSTLLARLTNLDTSPPTALPTETKSADSSNTQLTGRWAEVVYLLAPAGPPGTTTPTAFTTDDGGLTQLPLYTLYRRQRVLAAKTITSPTTGANVFDQADAAVARGVAMAKSGGVWSVLGPEMLTRASANRLGGASDGVAPPPTDTANNPLPAGPLLSDLQRRGYPIPANIPETGADVLVTNVVSMTIRPVYEFDVSAAVSKQLPPDPSPGSKFTYTPVPKSRVASAGQQVPYTPADWLELLNVRNDQTYQASNTPQQVPLPGVAAAPAFPRFFDTAGPSKIGVVFRDATTNAPLPINWDQQDPTLFEVSVRVKALEIKLRVYDAKNASTRQMTVLQDL